MLPVNTEASGGQYLEDNYHVMCEKITGDGPFNNHQLILSEWCLDLELIHS